MSINVNDKNIGHATAYAYYKAGGGTMTEAEFTEFMADFGTASQTAVEAAQAALASETAARNASTTATNKASEATTAAQTATSKAAEASTSASTATSAKDTAVSASQTATTKASEATTAAATATSAATTATTAKDDAVSAKASAETAQGKAETAQGAAEDAADRAEAALALKADVTDLLKAFPTDSAQGAIASFTDGAELPLKSLTVDIEPIQDLHGYDNPWPAGGGKNLLNPVVYEGFPKTLNGITTVLNSDGTFILNGTANARTYIGLATMDFNANTILNGCPSGGSSNTYVLSVDGTSIADRGSGYTITEAVTAGKLMIVIGNGYVCNNLVFKPMVRLSSVSDATFAPYSNICPISEHDEVNVVRTGKNLFNKDSVTIDLMSVYNAGGNPVSSQRSGFEYHLPSGTYTLANSGTFVAYIYGNVVDADHNFVSFFRLSTETGSVTSTITVNDGEYILIYHGTQSALDLTGTQIQIEVGSTATLYEPYSGQSINIQLGQTVYGGTLDVVSGVLTIADRLLTKNTAEMNNVEDFPGWQNSGIRALIGGGLNTAYVNQMLNVGTAFSVNTTGTSGDTLYLPKLGTQSYGMTQTEWKALAIDVQIVVPLATPLTIQLTPHEVTALLGSNNVWADTGDSTVEYRADPTLYIGRLTEPDADMVADANITSGQYFMVGNTLYKATANIASGATISPNVNCTRKSLSEALNELNA